MNEELVDTVSGSILYGFSRHFKRFKEITQQAKGRFEKADWDGEGFAQKSRIFLYDERVSETVEYIRERIDVAATDKVIWQDIKRQYMWKLYDHSQPELAESFYNSVFCRLFDREYFNNQHIFVKPGTAVDFLDMEDPSYVSWYPTDSCMEDCFRNILKSFELQIEWQDIERDIDFIIESISPLIETNSRSLPYLHFEVISSLFYRNKAAYLVGRAVVNQSRIPFVIPLLLDDSKKLYVDAVLTDSLDIALIFSFTRSYFMVNTEVPSALVTFLSTMLPTRSYADIYTSIGFQKQGKTLFYREFLHHLQHSSDKLIIAPGIKGMVMTVFTLPSYPFVFKVINDSFPPQKNMDRAMVKQKYQMVKTHDRVGRMADTLEFSHVAFPIDRFSDDLLEELKLTVPSSLTIDGENIIIRHLYIERRLVPLNIYLESADEQDYDRAVRSYGNAIKDIIGAGIFPGDMLLKNFGVTRHGRVIFYDYDEIRSITEIRIRKIPKARFDEEEYSDEIWYETEENDFFPEQFERFVMNHPKFRKIFLDYHSNLLNSQYWKNVQNNFNNKIRPHIFPYREEKRFVNLFKKRFTEID
ncbi:MAG: bifunctional isocitrate dehydrogenase kinase/phosphatase [Gammaproteobacteria bacterium]|nr:bifunctional isocitrate dehydrogenase kinase/phosphatase [Gammaproteobacteria bacterium]MCY4219885.1 bifunctional isocitrate dehydrogenase kinase/phosphatase [Gammaproteobacteria bacterium]